VKTSVSYTRHTAAKGLQNLYQYSNTLDRTVGYDTHANKATAH